MREKFHEHYRPTAADFDQLWRSATVAIDASVLLTPYRVTERTQSGLFAALRGAGERLWVPHQAALEFHHNRLAVIQERIKLVGKSRDAIAEAKRTFEAFYRDNPEAVRDELETAWAGLDFWLEDEQLALQELSTDLDSDRVWVAWLELIGPRVGDPNANQDDRAEREGRLRYEKKIPPGYADAAKPDDRKYGDLVLWWQLIAKANETQAPVLLVSADAKDDWWLKIGANTLGPRPELRREFRRETGQDFYLYSPDAYISLTQQRANADIDQATVDEIRSLNVRAFFVRRPSGTEADSVLGPAIVRWETEVQGSERRAKLIDTLIAEAQSTDLSDEANRERVARLHDNLVAERDEADRLRRNIESASAIRTAAWEGRNPQMAVVADLLVSSGSAIVTDWLRNHFSEIGEQEGS